MPHAVRPLNLTADQCHERARLVRGFAIGVTSCLLRQDLLDIAAEYERFAEGRSSADVLSGRSGSAANAGHGNDPPPDRLSRDFRFQQH